MEQCKENFEVYQNGSEILLFKYMNTSGHQTTNV